MNLKKKYYLSIINGINFFITYKIIFFRRIIYALNKYIIQI